MRFIIKFIILTMFTGVISACLITKVYSQNLSSDTDSSNKISKESNYNIHFQQTFVEQYHPPFYAKYSGKNSLFDTAENCLSLTSTLFIDAKLWHGAILTFNPEVAGGSGLSKAQGIAGFTNNEVVRVGNVAPTFYIARLFLEQTFNLEINKHQTATENVKINTTSIILRFGKYSVMDYFDVNQYSHDGRSQFLDWALVSNGAWDYSADTRGYTIAFMTEYNTPAFSARFAVGMVPNTPNGPIDPFSSSFLKINNLGKNHSFMFELEKPYKIFDKDGTVRMLIYANYSHIANFQQAIDLNAYSVDSTANVRKDGSTKSGIGMNIEQEINENIGAFLRAGWNDGRTETFMFTQIDRTLSFGTLIKGNYWNREYDNIGIALCFNGLSPQHATFLKKGGYGFIIGDGNLNYATETIFESFYRFNLTNFLQLSAFYQFVNNPAYNKDRGPVNVYSLRTHIEF